MISRNIVLMKILLSLSRTKESYTALIVYAIVATSNEAALF